jgi:hypothetical protein
VSNRVVLTFIGEAGNLSRTIARVEKDSAGLESKLMSLGKGFAAVGMASNGLQAVAALGTSLVQMSGAALLVPAALGAAGAAAGVLKIGMSGLGKAIEKGGKDLAKLRPEARQFATEVRALAPAWNAVRDAVQGNLFAGLGADIAVLGRSYLPMMRVELAHVATGWNQVARNALGALKAPEALGATRSVIHATGDALLNMQEALGNVVSGFFNLAGAGAKYIGGVGSGITRVTEMFDAWTQRITADGSFERWVAGAGKAFHELGSVIVQVGGIIAAIWQGLGYASTGLQPLADGLLKINTLLSDKAGQEALAALGDAMRQIGTALNGTVIATLQALLPVLTALARPPVTPHRRSLRSWSARSTCSHR